MTPLIALIIGLSIGYLLGSAGSRYHRSDDMQLLIELEAAKRKENGMYRIGDDTTETKPAECGVFRVREVLR
jgi:hypothetical protein